jgi:hypothetical protein
LLKKAARSIYERKQFCDGEHFSELLNSCTYCVQTEFEIAKVAAKEEHTLTLNNWPSSYQWVNVDMNENIHFRFICMDTVDSALQTGGRPLFRFLKNPEKWRVFVQNNYATLHMYHRNCH